MAKTNLLVSSDELIGDQSLDMALPPPNWIAKAPKAERILFAPSQNRVLNTLAIQRTHLAELEPMAQETPFESMVFGETEWRAVDFTARLDGDEIQEVPVWTATPSSLAVSEESVQGNIARVTISGGVAGTTYRLRCVATSIGGLIMIYDRSLTVTSK